MQSNRGSRTSRPCGALAAMIVFALVAQGVAALDFSGRVDSGYRLDYDDPVAINRVFSYQNFDMGLGEGLSLTFNGGLLSAIGSNSSAGISIRGLDDARNDADADKDNLGTWVDYQLFGMKVAYQSDLVGVQVGRLSDWSGAASAFDGAGATLSPLSFLRIRAFGGMPYSDGSVIRAIRSYPSKIGNGELEAGATFGLSLLDDKLALSAGYLYLAQSTDVDALIGSASNVVKNQTLRGSMSFAPATWLSTSLNATMIDFKPTYASFNANGLVDPLHLRYNLGGTVQLLAAAALGNSFNSFAAILGSANPYFSGSASVSEELGGFIPTGGLLKSVALDASVGRRQPLVASDVAQANPTITEFRAGPSLAFGFGLSANGYYSYVLSDSGSAKPETINAFGGELRYRKTPLDIRAGTAFTANEWTEDYLGSGYHDTFNAQTYYVRAKVNVTKTFDVQARMTYESSVLASVTGSATSTVRAEVRAGYRF